MNIQSSNNMIIAGQHTSAEIFTESIEDVAL